MAQPDDFTKDYRSKISYPQLSGDVSGNISKSGVTAGPTQPTPSTMSGSIPSSFAAPAIQPPVQGGNGGSGSGGGGGGGGPELRVNIQRPDNATAAPGVEPPPLGVRAARGLKAAVGTGLDAVGAVNNMVGAPARALGNAVSAAGTVASDFGKEYFNIQPPALNATPPANAPAPVVAPPPAAAPVSGDTGAVTAQPAVPKLLGGNGVQNQPPEIQRPALLTPPTLAANGPPPSLEAKDNQSIFEAMTNLGRSMADYRGKAQGNAIAQKSFENLLKTAGLDEKYAETAARERTALLDRASNSKIAAERIASAEKIAKMNSEALNRQVHIVQIGEESDPSDPLGVKRKVFGMSMLDDKGKPVVTDLTGKPIAAQQAKIEAPKAAIEQLKKNPDQKAAFKQKYGYLPAGI